MLVMDAIAQILKREGISTLFCFPTTPLIEAATMRRWLPTRSVGYPLRGLCLPYACQGSHRQKCVSPIFTTKAAITKGGIPVDNAARTSATEATSVMLS
jgi:hypothetical protein